jgi:hypothetical protein
MNCQEARKLLDNLESGSLSGEHARAVRMHFKTCSACAANLAPSQWVELLPVLDAEIQPSPDFTLRLNSRLKHVGMSGRNSVPEGGTELRPHISSACMQPWWKRISVRGWPRQLAAAGALAAVITGILAIRHPGTRQDASVSLGDYKVAEQLPLLRDMAVVSNLDLLEDFDAIENLSNLMKQEKSGPAAADGLR